MVDPTQQTLTVGQKLLKEPIWIGMIVIMNLVLFFCISYVIRRKCGQRISDMMPQRKKSLATVSPIESKAESSPSLSRSMYYMSTETPVLSPITYRKPTLTLSIKRPCQPDALSSTNASIPSTPVIDEHNSEAAMKLFAAYKTERQLDPKFSQLSIDRQRLPSDSNNFITCGFQGGTVSFSDDEDIQRDEIKATIKTDTRTFIRSKSSDTSKDTVEEIDNKMNRMFTYPNRARPKKDCHQDATTSNPHCYPEIHIVNEFNEKYLQTDSDNSVMNSPKLVKHISPCKTICDEDNTLPNNDSGYPSTSTLSSNNTQSTVQESHGIKHAYPSASDRRKRYGCKSTSTSFYKLSEHPLDTDNDDIGLQSVYAKATKMDKKQSIYPPKISRSFDVGHVCRSCSDIMRSGMSSFSCDTDTDKIRRYKSVSHCDTNIDKIRRYECVSHCCSRHDCARKRHQRRHKCCCSHTRVHHPRYFPRYTSPTSRYLSLSEIRDIRRNHKRALARLSSTESEVDYFESSCQRRRSNYGSFEHCSDGCVPNRRHFSASDRSLNRNCIKDDPFKRQMMQSFLSDTYNSNMQLRDSVDSYTCVDETRIGIGNQLLIPPNTTHDSINSVFRTSNDSSKSISPSREAPYSENESTLRTSRHPGHLEIVSDDNHYSNNHANTISSRHTSPGVISSTQTHNSPVIQYSNCPSPNDNSDAETDEFDDTGEVILQRLVRKTTESTAVLDDSAYQTKQSSVDIYTSTTAREELAQTIIPFTNNDLHQNKRGNSVRRHLHQAALKLVLMKRQQNRRDESKDSAIHTFSKDNMSTEEDTRRSFGKRKCTIQVMPMKDLQLPEVREELSGISSYTTPDNEVQTDISDTNSTEKADECSIINHVNGMMISDSIHFQETIV